MTTNSVMPMPQLQLSRLPTHQLLVPAASSQDSQSSYRSSSLLTSQEDSFASQKPADYLTNRPTTLLGLLRNRQVAPSFSQLNSEGTLEIDVKIDEKDMQLPISSDQIPENLPELNESSGEKSIGAFTHQSHISNVFQIEQEEEEILEPEDMTESKSVPKPVTPASPSESISSSEHHSQAQQTRVKDYFLERAGQRKDSTRQGLRWIKRQGSSSTLMSVDPMLVSGEIKESTLGLTRGRSMKSIVYSQFRSEPVTGGGESMEDVYRLKLEDYMEERGDSLSAAMKELYDAYMEGPTTDISELNVAQSGISDLDLRDFCQLVQAIRWLESIDLSSNGLTFQLFNVENDLYSRNITRVKSLLLNSNPIGNNEISPLFLGFLTCHVNVEEVFMANCEIMDEDFEKLVGNLKYLRLLTIIDLRNNKLTDKSVDKIVNLLRNCQELQKIMVNGNRFSKKAGKILKLQAGKVEFDVPIGWCCELF